MTANARQFVYRDKTVALKLIDKLRALNLELTLMHVCGTHQDTLVRFGLDALLKKTAIDIRQGPGCPVCVTTPKEIEEAILLAKHGHTVVTFGDLFKVPAPSGSLADVRAEGYNIKIVYSVEDAVKLAEKYPNQSIVFIAIGFETTAPSTAAVILNEPPSNFSILCCHRAIPPALKAIIELGELKLDGIIEPGHVSTVIGAVPYEFISRDYKVPQVIAGFEPLDLLLGVYMLAQQIKAGTAKVEIEYTRSVRWKGNPKAIKIMNEVFEPGATAWRGFPTIPDSWLKLRQKYAEFDARKRYGDVLSELDEEQFREPPGCRCGEVLRGIIYSNECPLFGNACTPAHPIGPCMVSAEGSCNIMLKYGRR